MDPPDNLGLEYVGYKDKRPDYYQWLSYIIKRSLRHCDTLWVSYFHSHDMILSKMIPDGIPWRKIIWRYQFGQYRETDLASGYRIILRLGDPGDIDAVRVPSVRMQMGDPRAKGPRVLDDVWDIPRVQGNNRERAHWHPTQHPREIYRRIYAYTNPLLDLFAGTGTGFHIGMEFGIEQSEFYCSKIGVTLAKSKEDFVQRINMVVHS